MSTTQRQKDTIPYEPRRRKKQLKRYPTLTILSHPMPDRVGDMARWVNPENEAWEISRLDPLFIDPREGKPSALNDVFMSRDPLRMHFVDGRLCFDASQTSTRIRVNGVDLKDRLDIPASALEHGVCVTLAERMCLLLHYAMDAVPETAYDFVGESDAVQEMRRQIERLGPGNKAILIQGESGTGKELVASALHEVCGRKGYGGRDAPLITVNMAALNKDTAVAALFGATKGSYTGAERPQVGYFKHADKGTLFLDEIGETDEGIQTMLLRAIENGEIQPLGMQEAKQVDVRLITATDANLGKKLADESFRNAFYNRLGSRMRIPPLRERREDLGRLILHFAKEELKSLNRSHYLQNRHPEEHPWLEPHHVEQLLAYDWPGNVRELANVVGDMVRHGDDEVVLDHANLLELLGLDDVTQALKPEALVEAENRLSTQRKPSRVKEKEFIEALRACDFNLTEAAEHLMIRRTSIYDVRKRYPDAEKAARLDAATLARLSEGSLEQAAKDLGIGETTLRLLMEMD